MSGIDLLRLEKQTQRVLVVEDSESLRKIVCVALGMEGYAVSGADDGLKALAYLERHPVDLLITDIGLPGMDGYELIGMTVRDFPALPVMVMTGDVTAAAVLRKKGGNVRRVLIKPVRLEALLESVDGILSGRHVRATTRMDR